MSNKNFSVIIPTMWKCEFFYRFLRELSECSAIDEIILIDNNPTQSPIKEPIDKLIYFPQQQNLGVNKSWNLGAKLAKNKYLCILNDDMIFDFRIFKKVQSFLDDPHTGVIGMAPGDFSNLINQPKFQNGLIDILPLSDEHLWGFGILWFINAEHWTNIPEELFIWFGDNFVVDYNKLLGRQNYIIANSLMFTPYSATVKDMINEWEVKDREAYDKIYKQMVKDLSSTT